MVQIKKYPRNNRADYFALKSNIDSSNMVSGASEPTLNTSERISGWSVPTSGSGFLEFSPEFGISFSRFINLLPTECISIIISSEVNNPQVNTESINSIQLRRFWSIYNHGKIESIISQNQVSLTPYPVHPDCLVFSNPDRYLQSSFEGKDRYSLQFSPGKDSLVINDSTIRTKFGFDRPVSLISFRNLSNCTNRMLGRQSELISNILINNLLNLDFISTLNRESNFRNIVASFIKPVHSLKKNLMLFFRRIKFNHQCLQHNIDNNRQWLINSWSWEGGVCFLPVLKY